MTRLRPSEVTRALTGWLAARIDGRRAIVLGVLVVSLAALLGIHARAKPFWHDEIYTILGSRLPVATLWRASLDGFDLSPPLNTVLTRVAHAAFGEGPLATRLPAIAGFLTAVVLIFVVVRRRTNAVVGLAAALLPCSTAMWRYALEARGYGLTLGLFALALYGWAEAAAGRRQTLHWMLMSAALAGGLWTHYYFVLAFLPIAAGETVRQITRRRFEIAPWAALAAAGIAAVPLSRLAARAAAQRATFWSHAESPGMLDTYAFLLGGLDVLWIPGIVLACILAVELARRAVSRQWTRRLAAHDLAAAMACLAIPAAGVLAGNWTEVFTPRYVLFSTTGLALAIPLILWWLAPANGLGDLVGMAAVAIALGIFAFNTMAHPPVLQDPLSKRPLLADWLRRDEPTVITGGVVYLELWFYTPDAAKPRAIYLADPRGQRRDTGWDTSDRGYLALARWSPVPIVPIGEFVRTHKRFWLYSLRSSWVERTLKFWGGRLIDRGRERGDSATLFEVIMPERVVGRAGVGPAN